MMKLSQQTFAFFFLHCLGSLSLLPTTMVLADKESKKYKGTITVTNLAPINGTCQTPVWVGIHNGTFDVYDRDQPIPEAFESLAEDGDATAAEASFRTTPGSVWDKTVGDKPICYGEKAMLDFEIMVMPGEVHYFSYASMVLPSNDAWVANGNPMAYKIFDMDGKFVPVSFDVLGANVLDAGTEENDEDPTNTAFFGQAPTGNTGTTTANGAVTTHPGFNPVGSGGILDDPKFANADFKATDYKMMSIQVTATEEETSSDSSDDSAAATSLTVVLEYTIFLLLSLFFVL